MFEAAGACCFTRSRRARCMRCRDRYAESRAGNTLRVSTRRLFRGEDEVRAWSEIYSRADARAKRCVARKRVDGMLTVRSVDDAPDLALIVGGYHSWANVARWRGAFAGSRVAAKARL